MPQFLVMKIPKEQHEAFETWYEDQGRPQEMHFVSTKEEPTCSCGQSLPHKTTFFFTPELEPACIVCEKIEPN